VSLSKSSSKNDFALASNHFSLSESFKNGWGWRFLCVPNCCESNRDHFDGEKISSHDWTADQSGYNSSLKLDAVLERLALVIF
jgi:hypothetical protein